MAILVPASTILYLQNIVMHQQINPTGNQVKIRIEWNHPRKGRIAEEVCEEHEKELLNALRTLAIGCSATYSKRDICWRCTYSGYAFREWIDNLSAESM